MKQLILIADDEIDMLNLVASKLTAAGFEVVKTDDGPSALNSARSRVPDLIVLDRMMPGMSGLEVCKTLKAEAATSEVPVILLTAHNGDSDRLNAFAYGVDEYISKPFSLRDLLVRIEALLLLKSDIDRHDFNRQQAPPEEFPWN